MLINLGVALVSTMLVAVCLIVLFTSNGRRTLALFGELDERLSSLSHDEAKESSFEYTEEIVEKQANVTGSFMGGYRKILELEKLNLEKMYEGKPGNEAEIIDAVAELLGEAFTDDASMQHAYIVTASGVQRELGNEERFAGKDLRDSEAYKQISEGDGEFVWTEAYSDREGRPVITGGTAFHDVDGTVAGVIATDLFFDSVMPRIMNAKIGEDGMAFIVVSDENAFPTETIGSLVKKDEKWKKCIADIFSTKKGSLTGEIDGKPVYVIFRQIPGMEWIFCSVITDEEIAGTADLIQAEIELSETDFAAQTTGNFRNILAAAVLMILLVLLGTAVVSYLVAGMFTRPILDLHKGVEAIGGGNLDRRIEVKSADEIGELTEAYNAMATRLLEYIDDVKKMAAEKEHVEAEMSMAADIQSGMLPGGPISGVGYEAAGFMRPAKSVGGDYYDYFEVDDTHVAFVIADVSDKGIPAALFMAIGRTVTREITKSGDGLEDVFFRVNNILSRNNENCQFITAFEAVLDRVTGEVTYVNAGHEPPMIVHVDGSVEEVYIKSGLPLGIMEDCSYETGSLKLKCGELLYMYTDGVTDGVNSQEERFERDRIVKFLSSVNRDAFVLEEIGRFVEELDRYSQGMSQADDITMLMLRYNGTK